MTTEQERYLSTAISEFFGAVTAGLADYAKTLPRDLAGDERRELLLTEARKQGLAAVSLLGWIPETWEKENARETFHQFIDAQFKSHEGMNGRELAEAIIAKLPWDSFLVDYVEAYGSSGDGKPPPIGDSRGLGGAFSPKWNDKELPVVFAFATRYAPRSLVVRQFNNAILRRFGRRGQPTARTLALVAWYTRRRAQGKSHRETATELAEPGLVGRPEWENKKTRRRAITVAGDVLRRNKNRLLKYGTKKP
jgi:hypothetical protein